MIYLNIKLYLVISFDQLYFMILDVKIRVPRFEGNSWLAFPTFRGAYKHVQIYIEFKPEKNQGMILLTGTI